MSEPSSRENRDADLIREVVRPQRRRRFRRFLVSLLLALIGGAAAGCVLWLLQSLPGPNEWLNRHRTEASSEETPGETAGQTPEESTEATEPPATESAEESTPEAPSETEEGSSEAGPGAAEESLALALESVTRRLEEAESRLAEAESRMAAMAGGEMPEGPEQVAPRDAAKPYLVTVVSTTEQTDWMQNTTHTSTETWGLVVSMREDSFYVLLNRAEADPGSRVTVRFGNSVYEELTWLATDPLTGLSMIAVTADMAELDGVMKTAVFASAQSVVPGDDLVCLGSPYGQSGAYAAGHLSFRSSYAGLEDMTLPILCLDLPRGKGSGFLITPEGTVVGWLMDLPAAGYENMMTAAGIWGFSDVTADLTAGRTPARLGIFGETVPDSVQKENGVPAGVYVNQLRAGSPAEEAGVISGDIITAFGDTRLNAMQELSHLLARAETGTEVPVTVMRWTREGYQEMVFTVLLQ